MISLQHIDVVFEQDKKLITAVDDVSLEIEAGDIFGIIGYSGAVKSTLVRTMNLLQRPTNHGKVFVNGVELTALSASDLRHARKKIGMIFQHFNLMTTLSVFENVAFPLKHASLSKEALHEKVMNLLHLVGLSDKAHTYPRQLSGGQKQRVAIARALANDPSVLLCDEATSALDPKTTDSILELLKELNEKLGITIVLITHEMQVVKQICDKVAIMEDGKLIESGTILKIFTEPQEELTKQFIDTATHVNKGIQTVLHHEKLLNLKDGDILVKLTFVGESTGQPLITRLSSDYQVAASILYGNVEIIQETPYGTLLVALSGEGHRIDEALQSFAKTGTKAEVIEDLRRER